MVLAAPSTSVDVIIVALSSNSASTSSPLWFSGGLDERMSLRRCIFGGFKWCLGTGSEGRNASVSCTVRMCLARASERVNERSHSVVQSKLHDHLHMALGLPGNAQ